MELIVQYLDDLEDLVYAVALLAERIGNVLRFMLFMIASVSLQLLGIFIALINPPIAVAVASLLLVGMLYRSVVHSPRLQLKNA